MTFEDFIQSQNISGLEENVEYSKEEIEVEQDELREVKCIENVEEVIRDYTPLKRVQQTFVSEETMQPINEKKRKRKRQKTVAVKDKKKKKVDKLIQKDQTSATIEDVQGQKIFISVEVTQQTNEDVQQDDIVDSIQSKEHNLESEHSQPSSSQDELANLSNVEDQSKEENVEELVHKDKITNVEEIIQQQEDNINTIEPEELIDEGKGADPEIGGGRYMGVEEFIQRVIGDDDQEEKEEATMIVDRSAEADVERRLRSVLARVQRGDAGVRPPPETTRRVKVFTADEIEAMKKRPRPPKVSKPAAPTPAPAEKPLPKKELPESLKTLLSMHQCYVCFKVFKTKPELFHHCKSHFSVCSESTLARCPLCGRVLRAARRLRQHLRETHGESVSIAFMGIMDRKDNASGSRYYYETENENVKELEIIPSVKILNKKASMEIDRKNRERKNKFVGTSKLVRKGDEWIVEKEKLDLSNHVLPDSKVLDKNCENYLDVIKKLGTEAKRKGVKMLYPCNKCEKVCQNLSALTLHSRRHDPNPKPFRPRGSGRKDKEMREKTLAKRTKKQNRLEKPKPIVNNHKCDPKLMDFYENNIKGGDIEFWQFLKIYNKMNKEKVESFKDLEETTEFGIHYDKNKKDYDVVIDKDILDGPSKSKTKEEFPKGLNKRYVRTIRITKVEYNKRKEIKNKMRERLAQEKS